MFRTLEPFQDQDDYCFHRYIHRPVFPKLEGSIFLVIAVVCLYYVFVEAEPTAQQINPPFPSIAAMLLCSFNKHTHLCAAQEKGEGLVH
jgi:hypothetical protein